MGISVGEDDKQWMNYVKDDIANQTPELGLSRSQVKKNDL